jgi:hypothetical protein
MAIVFSPSIVTSGLIMYVDAANPRSYSGSGSTWTDLSGTGNNMTLSGSPTYSSSTNGGSFVFAVGKSATNSLNLTNTTYTISYATKMTGTLNSRVLQANSNNWFLGYWQGKNDVYHAQGWVVGYETPSLVTTNADTNWQVYTGTGNYSTGSYSLYKNGNLLTNTAGTTGANGPNGLSIGQAGIYSGEYSNFTASNIMAYNRVLTAAEVKQNFNALRGRFSI